MPKPFIYLFTLLLALLLGCSGPGTVKVSANDGEPLVDRVIQEIPGQRPPWVDLTPENSEGNLFFTGASGFTSAEPEARDLALRAAVAKFAAHCGTDVSSVAEYIVSGTAKAGDTANPDITIKDVTTQKVENFVSRVKDREWYTKRIERTKGGIVQSYAWESWVLVSVPESEVAVVQEIYRVRKAREEEAKRKEAMAPFASQIELFQSVSSLREGALKAAADGKPLEGAASLLSALENYKILLKDPKFPEASVFMEEGGVLPLENDLLALLNAIKIKADKPAIKMPAGSKISEPLAIRATHGDLPLSNVSILFEGEGQAAKLTTDSSGTAFFRPMDTELWPAGNHIIKASLENPLLSQKDGAKFSAAKSVTFTIEVNDMDEAEKIRANEEVFETLAANLAEGLGTPGAAGKLGTVAVLSEAKEGPNGDLTQAVNRTFTSHLAARREFTVKDTGYLERALGEYGVKPSEVNTREDSLSAGQTLKLGGIINCEARLEGGKIHFSAKLLEVRTGNVLAVEEATLGLTDAFRSAMEATGVRNPGGVELATRFFYETPLSDPAPLREGERLRSGDHYRLEFQTERRLYVYAYQVDSSGVVIPLFPNPAFSPFGNPVNPGAGVSLPQSGDWWTLDQTKGTEELTVIASRIPLRRVEEVFAALLDAPAASRNIGDLLPKRGEESGAQKEITLLDSKNNPHSAALSVLKGTGLGISQRVRFNHD